MLVSAVNPILANVLANTLNPFIQSKKREFQFINDQAHKPLSPSAEASKTRPSKALSPDTQESESCDDKSTQPNSSHPEIKSPKIPAPQ